MKRPKESNSSSPVKVIRLYKPDICSLVEISIDLELPIEVFKGQINSLIISKDLISLFNLPFQILLFFSLSH
jgi:hypothetical protein